MSIVGSVKLPVRRVFNKFRRWSAVQQGTTTKQRKNLFLQEKRSSPNLRVSHKLERDREKTRRRFENVAPGCTVRPVHVECEGQSISSVVCISSSRKIGSRHLAFPSHHTLLLCHRTGDLFRK
eukprot:scpid67466/ scgid25961/ 